MTLNTPKLSKATRKEKIEAIACAAEDVAVGNAILLELNPHDLTDIHKLMLARQIAIMAKMNNDEVEL